MLPRFQVVLLAAAIVIICLLPADIQSTGAGQQPDDSVGIIRKEKPGRPKPPPGVLRAPLLALQWWVIIRSRDCRPQEFDSKAALAVDDMVRIGITVNQTGYLYAFNDSKTGDNCTLVYPDPRINRGNNLVRKDTPVILPNNCPSPEERDSDCPRDVNMASVCWWQITKYYKGDITLIFSRGKINQFEREIEKASSNPTGADSLPEIPRALLEKIKRETVLEQDLKTDQIRPQPSKMGTIINNFTTKVTNTNRRDNEEVIETITLKLQKR